MRIGSHGEHVAVLQRQINETGLFTLVDDGIFGPRTEAAVKALQAHIGLPATGEVDHGLRAALRVWDILPPAVTGPDLQSVAYRLRVDYPAIVAIVAVESRGRGFLDTGRPVILFERHVFRRRLIQHRVSLEGLPPDLVNRNAGGYRGGEGEWSRMTRAMEIHRGAAIESASWGLFQIMGFHWQRLGYDSAEHWYERMQESEWRQTEAFARFLEEDPVLLQALREHRWEAVARRYNGPNYAKNRYDLRLAEEYAAALRGVG